MKVLLPISSEQTITIIPRSMVSLYSFTDYENRVNADSGNMIVESVCLGNSFGGEFNSISATITKDGEGVSETISPLTLSDNGNFTDVTFASTILEEGFGYFLEIKNSGALFYRDKIYVTSQSDFKIKHKQPQNNYTEYNSVDDNTYIV